MLEELTLLIASKGRPKELGALLQYFERNQITCKILILESGNLYRHIVGAYASLDIELHEFDAEALLSHKLLESSQWIKTAWVCFCADDDLVLSEGIEKSYQFLIEHPEYSACQGYHARFEQRGKDVFLLDFLWFTPSLVADDPMVRLKNLMTRYQPICWAMFRTDVLLLMHQHYDDFKSPLFFELFWSSMAAIAGKVKRIPTLYCLRKNDAMQPFGHPLYLFAESPENFIHDYLMYRTCLEKALKRGTKATIRRVLDLIHTCLFHAGIDQSVLQYISQKAIENPEFSILHAEHYAAIQIGIPPIQTNGHMKMQYGSHTYHFAEKFINPEPVHEIHMPKAFHLQYLNDLNQYFCP